MADCSLPHEQPRERDHVSPASAQVMFDRRDHGGAQHPGRRAAHIALDQAAKPVEVLLVQAPQAHVPEGESLAHRPREADRSAPGGGQARTVQVHVRVAASQVPRPSAAGPIELNNQAR